MSASSNIQQFGNPRIPSLKSTMSNLALGNTVAKEPQAISVIPEKPMPGLENTVHPEQPNDASDNLRIALWVETFLSRPHKNTAIDRYSKNSYDMADISIVGSLMLGVTATIGSIALMWESNYETATIFLLMSVLCFTTSYCMEKLSKKIYKWQRLTYFMQNGRWIHVYMHAVSEARKVGCNISHEFNNLDFSLRTLQQKDITVPLLGSKDIIDIVNISDGILSASRSLNPTNMVVKPSGENSEILSRIHEHVAGRSPEKITQETCFVV